MGFVPQLILRGARQLDLVVDLPQGRDAAHRLHGHLGVRTRILAHQLVTIRLPDIEFGGQVIFERISSFWVLGHG